MSGADAALRWREAKRWFAVAEQEVAVAGAGLDPPAVETAAYLCQQAAEKLIKGLLIAADVAFPRVHDLDRLADLAAPHYPALVPHLDACRMLTTWGVAFRYPDTMAPEVAPSAEELADTLAALERFRAAVRAIEPV